MTGVADADVPDSLRDHLYALVGRLLESDGLLVLSDFDGSLAPIEDHPDDARLPEPTRDVLADLRDAAKVEVGVVSGRGLADLRDRVGLDGVAYAGNHGLEAFTDGEKTVHPAARSGRDEIAAIVADLDAQLLDIDGAFVEDKDVTASVHYRLAPDNAESRVERAVRDAANDADDVRVTSGKQVLELRPDVEWDKGRATRWLYDRCVPDDESWVPLYVGDDRTDEDAFRALSEPGLGIKVGHQPPTVARYRVPDPVAVRETLDWLADYGVEFLHDDPRERPASGVP